MSIDVKERWVHWLHIMWSIKLSYNLQIFGWLMTIRGFHPKPNWERMGLLMGYAEFVTARRLWSMFSRSNCLPSIVKVTWRINTKCFCKICCFGVLLSLEMAIILFTLLSPGFKFKLYSTFGRSCVFRFLRMSIVLSVFCSLWWDEICHLAKGTSLIKGSQSLDTATYYDFFPT